MSEDLLITLNSRLNKISEGLKAFKEAGLNEELLICYLMVNSKLSRKRAIHLINDVSSFYENLVKDELLNKLEESNCFIK
jgi:hypothetical protein